MQDILVALDLETTGLSAQDDAIIEIGAVKFRGGPDGEVLGTFQTYINPDRPIPPRVTTITGITADKLIGAPRLVEQLPKFKAFVGECNIVGHNVGFDVEFLKVNGLPLPGVVIDTYELASILLPTAPRYNLNAIVQALHLTVDGDFHSALTDSIASMLVYNALWDRLTTEIPHDILSNIVEAAKGLPWLGKLPFEAALKAAVIPQVAKKPEFTSPPNPLSANGEGESESKKIQVPVSEGGGERAGSVRDMVEGAMTFGTPLLLEVPAGVERGVGYLAAALRVSEAQGEPVLIATYNQYTHETQDRLRTVDLVEAAAMTGLEPISAVQKSRAYYLCPRRLETLRRRPPTSIEELRVLAKILVWGESGLSSDRDSISLRGPAEYLAWTRLSAEDEQCTLERCETQMAGACPFYKACKAAQTANLVFVDQGLLFADAVSDAPILPESDYLIVDEAHHLEDAATNALGKRLDLADFKRLLADLGSLDKGLIADLFTVIEPALSEKQRDNTRDYLKVLADSVRGMQYHSGKLYESLGALLAAEGANKGDFIIQTRMNQGLRERSSFQMIPHTWSILREFMADVSQAMVKLADRMVILQDRLDNPALPDVIASARAAAMHLDSTYDQLAAFIDKPQPDVVYWLDSGQDQPIPVIRSAPLHVGTVAAVSLWKRRSTVITGTTLQAGGSFEYLRDQLRAPATVDEQIIENPANFKDNVLLYLPTDIPEPNDKDGYQKMLERAVIELGGALDGRTLALFTGYGQMRATSQAVAARLALSAIQVLDQSDGTSRQALIEGFDTAEKAVLFGGKQFWEEADLSTDKLAALIITRLPFATPGEAVNSARSETSRESFNQLSVPDAVIKFRQGFDRLACPRVGKRGVVVVLDKRIISKGYGQTFIDSLPPVTVQRGTLAELGRTAKGWIDKA